MIHIKVDDITRIESEAAVVASLVFHPDFSFFSEDLKPDHFTNKDNRYLYTAIYKLAQRDIMKIDALNILEVLKSDEETARYASEISPSQITEFLDNCEFIAKHTVQDYLLSVGNVMDAAFRRDTFRKLQECQQLCFNESVDNIEQRVYKALDDVMMEYSSTNEVPQYKDVVDDCWNEIQSRQSSGYSGIPFKFSALNDFATIERSELFIFGAEQKQGKSIMLLNCAVDLMKQGYSVLYLDSELNTRLFTARILAHLSGVEYKRLASGMYSTEEHNKITSALEWLKTTSFTHIYMPTFDQQSIYTTVKKVYHTQGIDVLIVDYFKGSGEGDAFAAYTELGRLVDMVKNQICGDMNIAGVGAAQATMSGRLADSAKIARNASTIAMICDKTPEEIEMDGAECGNKKLRVVVNRNGMQHAQGEYIDLRFDGNHILYEQTKQHIPQTPF